MEGVGRPRLPTCPGAPLPLEALPLPGIVEPCGDVAGQARQFHAALNDVVEVARPYRAQQLLDNLANVVVGAIDVERFAVRPPVGTAVGSASGLAPDNRCAAWA